MSDTLYDGTGQPVPRSVILAYPIDQADIFLNGHPLVAPYPSTLTDSSGAFAIVLPDSTQITPRAQQWAVQVGNTFFIGIPPSGMSSLTIYRSATERDQMLARGTFTVIED